MRDPGRHAAEADGGDDAELRAVIGAEQNGCAFQLIPFDDLCLQVLPGRQGLVKGLLPRAGLAVVWGAPKSGKSFWSMDLGLHVAAGWTYRDRPVEQAVVVYCALEGAEGFALRLKAFLKHHTSEPDARDPGDDLPFYLLMTKLNLIADADALVASIAMQLSDETPGLIVVDTLNRSLAGSESKDEDMAAFLAAVGKLEQRFNCLVLVIHHSGVDSTRPRGHTSLTAAADVQISVKRGGADEVIATLEFAKDMPEGAEIVSRLHSVRIGTDDDGDPITSCVVVPADPTAPRPNTTRKLSDRQRLALDAFDECAARVGKPAPLSLELPAGIIAVPSEAWREELYVRSVLDRDAASPREDYRRLRNSLQARRLIGVRDDLVWKA